MNLKIQTQTALQIIRKDSNEFEDAIWSLIWRAPTQQRIRAFLWLACHDRLLGNGNRYRRHLTDDPKCFICGELDESTLHILRSCPAARCVWNKVGGPANSQAFYQGELKSWVTSNLEYNNGDTDVDWPIYFCTTLWWIWRWRNCYVFNRGDEIPVDARAFIRVRVDETKRSLESLAVNIPAAPRLMKEIYVNWEAPPLGWYTLNTDGAAKGCPGPAGGGAIIRDHHGTLVSALVANFGSCTSFRAEVAALVKGLELARDLMIRNLVVQLDNLACVQAMKCIEQGTGECAHLINYCRLMLSKDDWTVRVTHIYREGNRAADWLANHGVAQPLRTRILEDTPLALNRIIDEDIRGVALPRLIPP